jgi:transcriptional regulator with XRE-family HTH domain
MYIYKGELYLEKNHIKLLKKEPEYVKQRYHVVVSILSPRSNVTRQKSAQTLELSKRQFQRILKRFQMEGIPGLQHKSKRPNRSPDKTPTWLENIIVRVRAETGFLEDDVVYDRFGIQAITLETLRNYLLEGLSLRVCAGHGGLYVNLDREKLRKLREEQNISLGSFARFVRVSRRTARMYEDGMNARVEVASRIEEILGNTVTIPIDIIRPQSTEKKDITTFHGETARLREFQREIFKLN